jgi:hypothetical protein
MRTDGETDRQTEKTTKATFAFLNFADAPNKLEEHRQYNAWENKVSSIWFTDVIQS